MVDVVAKVEHVQLGQQCRMRVVLSQECRQNVERLLDIRSTLSKIERVEFDSVASVTVCTGPNTYDWLPPEPLKSWL